MSLNIILTAIKNYKTVILGGILSIVMVTISSVYYNYKIGSIKDEYNNYKQATEKEFLKQKLNILEQNTILLKEKDELTIKLKYIEEENYAKITKLQKENSDIRKSIINESRRLYINAKCTESSDKAGENGKTITASVDDGKTTRVIIDPRDAESIIKITEKADKYKIQLEALQEWVKQK